MSYAGLEVWCLGFSKASKTRSYTHFNLQVQVFRHNLDPGF